MNRRTALRTLVAAAASIAGIAHAARVASPRAVGIKPDRHCVLIVVDVQNCFVPGGTLAVPHGDEVIPVINRIAPAFQNVVMTQDWHPAGHASFASSHPGGKPYATLRVPYGNQVLWPDHCVQGTADADLDRDLRIPQAELILRKGFHKGVDSYSAFQEADRKTSTGLQGYLAQRGITTVFVAGLATDFCVAWTALDACAAHFKTYVVDDACRGIDLNGSVAAAWRAMREHGALRIQSTDIAVGA